MNPMFNNTNQAYEKFRATVKIWLPALQTLDGTDFNNPDIYVAVDVPEGDEYVVTLTALCQAGPEDMDVVCRRDSVKTADGRGCASAPGQRATVEVELEIDCPGGTDEGTVEIRVEAVGDATTCTPYTMTVDVD